MGIGANSDFLPDQFFQKGDWSNIKHVVCIPACNEISLFPVLNSINHCSSIANVAVVVAINAAENADENIKKTNQKAFDELVNSQEANSFWFPWMVELYNHLSPKKAGVGLARKLAMDRACKEIKTISGENILLCLDADCTVSTNWVQEIINYFSANKNIKAASVYFEHPVPEDALLTEAILLYEMHLRYLKQALQWAGFPWYFHTVGSSMALRAETYVKNGGMNTRQAGEDFYFLHKLMPLGFGEINTATVFPAARFSDRVPFGTGRSMMEFRENRTQTTYDFEIFKQLKLFFDGLNSKGISAFSNWGEYCSEALQVFFENEGLENARLEALQYASNEDKAHQRFLKWFSGFRIIKLLHFLRDSGFPDGDVTENVEIYLKEINADTSNNFLQILRQIDKDC